MFEKLTGPLRSLVTSIRDIGQPADVKDADVASVKTEDHTALLIPKSEQILPGFWDRTPPGMTEANWLKSPYPRFIDFLRAQGRVLSSEDGVKIMDGMPFAFELSSSGMTPVAIEAEKIYSKGEIIPKGAMIYSVTFIVNNALYSGDLAATSANGTANANPK